MPAVLQSNQRELFMSAIESYLFLLTLLSPSFANALGVAELIKGALNYHPSISQQKDLRAANLKGLESAKWEYFPTPSISFEGVDTSKEDLSYTGKDDYAIRLGLSQPLYTGGKITAGIESVEAAIASSDASLSQTYERISLQIVGDPLHLILQCYNLLQLSLNILEHN